jgi:hypothetical protein
VVDPEEWNLKEYTTARWNDVAAILNFFYIGRINLDLKSSGWHFHLSVRGLGGGTPGLWHQM